MHNENEWFASFLEQLEKTANKPANQKEAVKKITQQYYDDIGIALLSKEEPNSIKVAELKKRNLSKRASEKTPLKDKQEVIEAVDSFCRNSGGNKSTYSILSFLRGMLGKENVSYTDKEMIDYINSRKKEFADVSKRIDNTNVGKAGTEHDYADTVADYANRGR